MTFLQSTDQAPSIKKAILNSCATLNTTQYEPGMRRDYLKYLYLPARRLDTSYLLSFAFRLFYKLALYVGYLTISTRQDLVTCYFHLPRIT